MTKMQTWPTNGAQDACPVQFGAVCWRMHRSKVEVLLITSRDTGRWVIPKGWPIVGQPSADSAAQEAWEEAGVTGDVGADALGLFHYEKVINAKFALSCQVEVFGLRVEKLHGRFPERKERRRKWFACDKAARKVNEPELRDLLQNISHLLGVDSMPAAGV